MHEHCVLNRTGLLVKADLLNRFWPNSWAFSWKKQRMAAMRLGTSIQSPGRSHLFSVLRCPQIPYALKPSRNKTLSTSVSRIRGRVAAGAQEQHAAGEGQAQHHERPLVWPTRTHGAGLLRLPDAGTSVTLCGWVDRNRDMGGLQFFDLRDHTGLLQVGLWE